MKNSQGINNNDIDIGMKNLKRETKSLLIEALNNAARTNYVKAKIDNAQRNSKCKSCGGNNETINRIISEYC